MASVDRKSCMIGQDMLLNEKPFYAEIARVKNLVSYRADSGSTHVCVMAEISTRAVSSVYRHTYIHTYIQTRQSETTVTLLRMRRGLIIIILCVCVPPKLTYIHVLTGR